MKTILLNIIAIFVFVSCTAQQNKSIEDVVGFEKYDKGTVVFVDNLYREAIPEVFKEFYYNQLNDRDFHKPQSIVSESDNTRMVDLKTKQAKDGYLHINKYANEFIANNKVVLIVVNQDTVDTKEEVLNLIKMKRTEVFSIDTIITKEYPLIKIN